MLVDLHTHTFHHSLDSSLSLDALIAGAKARGLDGVCLTEHNALWDKRKLLDASAENGIALLPGIEVGTEQGHVLVFGLERLDRRIFLIETLRKLVLAERGLMVLAHPYRQPGGSLGRAELVRYFDAIEVLNGHEASGCNSDPINLSAELGLPGTGGSDAHSIEEIGTCVTRFEMKVRSVEELVREIRAGRVSPVNLGEVSSTSTP